MNKETEYFLNQLKDMEQLAKEGKDLGALAKSNVERILWENVDKGLDEWYERKRANKPNPKGGDTATQSK